VELTLEIEGEGAVPALPGGGAALVAFMSFAVSRGFGATHPLIALADLLHETHRVRLGPLTTFYEGEIADAEDAQKLELAWQSAVELRASLEGLVRVLETDEMAATFARRGGGEGLGEQAAALLGPLGRAEEKGARVRLLYAL
jgi:hypothetical protein